jgi:hypothetical protein
MSENVKRYKGDDPHFLRSCERAGVTPTNRQYRKWKQGRGLAYQHRHEG